MGSLVIPIMPAMSVRSISDEAILAAIKQFGTQVAAAKFLGISKQAVSHRLKTMARGKRKPGRPVSPESNWVSQSNWTQEQKNEYQRLWAKSHRPELAIKQKKWCDKNREHLRKYQRDQHHKKNSITPPIIEE